MEKEALVSYVVKEASDTVSGNDMESGLICNQDSDSGHPGVGLQGPQGVDRRNLLLAWNLTKRNAPSPLSPGTYLGTYGR